MAKIVSIHSFRGGTGKSNTTANLAALMALRGQRVAVVDTDIASPGIHVLFGLEDASAGRSLNDYLRGHCSIEEAAHDVTASLGRDVAAGAAGKLFLVPSRINAGEITRILHDGYDVGLLSKGFHALGRKLGLDAVLVDTHPGVNEETLLSMAISDVLVIVLRPDQQDYQGTAVAVEVAQKLGVPCLRLIVNKAPAALDAQALQARVEETYGCPVVGVFPHSDDMMMLASGGVFAARYPGHPLTMLYRQALDRLDL
jgi:MinD-like ATPase involved in chromosome partitioning or flagellar assembly